MVCPTIEGSTVEARLHVLMTRRSRVSLSFSIFCTRWAATNGPFFKDLATLLRAPSADDHLVGALVAARLFAHRHLAPRRGRRTSRGGTCLAATVRMIDGIHR